MGRIISLHWIILIVLCALVIPTAHGMVDDPLDTSSSIEVDGEDGDTLDGVGLRVSSLAASPLCDAFDEPILERCEQQSRNSKWTARYTGQKTGSDFGYSVTTSPDGSTVYVTGRSDRSATESEYVTVAYSNETGEQLWLSRYNGSAAQATPVAIAVGPDGEYVYVAGRLGERFSRNADYGTVAYDADTGERVWSEQYDGPEGDYDAATDIDVNPVTGTVYVTGTSTGGSEDYLTVAYDGATGSQAWTARFGGAGNGDDVALDMAVSDNGEHVYVTGAGIREEVGGRFARLSTGYDYATVAYDAATGIQSWSAYHQGPADETDAAFAVTVGPNDERVYVTGIVTDENGTASYGTVAYGTADGNERWSKQYEGATNGSDVAYDVAVTPDGSSVVVTGESEHPGGLAAYATVSYESATGTERWVSRYNGTRNGARVADGYALSVTPGSDSDQVYVTGAHATSYTKHFAEYNYATVAYGVDGGERIWVNQYNESTNTADAATAVAVSDDGARAYVTGESVGDNTSFDMGTIAVDTKNGKQAWTARYAGSGQTGADIAEAMAVGPDGESVYVTGSSWRGGSGYNDDYGTIAYNATTGEKRWTAVYNGPDNYYDVAKDIAVGPDGEFVYVTGASWSDNTNLNYLTLALDAETGERVWKVRYEGPQKGGTDIANAVAVGPAGQQLYVTGQSSGHEGYDAVTIALDAETGKRLWDRRFEGEGGHDGGTEVGVSPDGSRVYVAGLGTGNGTGFDYIAVAYDAETGTRAWDARYNGEFDGDDELNAMAVSPNGEYVAVTGESNGPSLANNYDYATVVYDADTGDERWTDRYDGPDDGWDMAEDIGVGPDGQFVYVTGQADGRDSTVQGVSVESRGWAYTTIAYDSKTGSRLWLSRTNESEGGGSEPGALAVSPDGDRLVVSGRGLRNISTISYDTTTGAKQWTAKYPGPTRHPDSVSAAAFHPTGSTVYVAGVSYDYGTRDDYVTIAYNATG